MRKSIFEFVAICAEKLPLREPVYEFGSYQVEQQEHMDLRPLFKGFAYVGSDMRAGPGVDKILNLHELDLEDKSVGTALMLDTLEHVEYPHKALKELHRVLDNKGIVIMSSVMKFPIHSYPYDYWRFTPEAFRSLLKDFSYSFVDFAGEELFPHTVVGVGFKGSIPEDVVSAFTREVEPWKQWARVGSWAEWTDYPPEDLWPPDTPLEKVARRWAPPAVFDAAKKLRSRLRSSQPFRREPDENPHSE